MIIPTLTSGVNDKDPQASTGGQVAATVNLLIDQGEEILSQIIDLEAIDLSLQNQINSSIKRVQNLKALASITPVDGYTYLVSEFNTGTSMGSLLLKFNAAKTWTSADIGKVFPVVALTAWNGTAAGLSTLYGSHGTGTGCYERLSNVSCPTQFGAVLNDPSLDGSLALKTAMHAGVVSSKLSGNLYIKSKVIVKNVDVSIDLPNILLVEDNLSTGQTMQIRTDFREIGNVTSSEIVSTPGGSTVYKITTAGTHTAVVGDVVKVYCDDLISWKTDERIAEFLVVYSVTGNTITFQSSNIFPHITNPRYAILGSNRLNIGSLVFDSVNPDAAVITFGYHLLIEGFVAPQIGSIEVIKGKSFAIGTNSCFRATIEKTVAHYLRNATTVGCFGYAAVDFGSQESSWLFIESARCRHAYTTGANGASANSGDPFLYGGAVRCKVFKGTAINSSNVAWDTHEDAYECEFYDISASGGVRDTSVAAGGFQDRANRTKVHKFTFFSNSGSLSENGVLQNTSSKGLWIGEYNYTGTNIPLRTSTTYASELIVETLNLFVNSTINHCIRNDGTLNYIRIKSINVYLSGKAKPNGNFLRVYNDVHIDEINWYADRLTEATTTYPTLIWNAGTSGAVNVYVGKNRLFLNALSWSLAGMTVLNGGGNALGSVYCDTEIHWQGYDGRNLTSTNYVYGVTAGNVITALSVNKSTKTTTSPEITINSTSKALSFGLDYSPYSTQVGKVPHQVIKARVLSLSETSVFTSMPVPAFVGQELDIYCVKTSGSGTPQGFKIAVAATNLLSGTDIVFTQGQLKKFISNSALQWELVT